MEHPTLFMLLLGCRPPGRNTEQHDVFFGIANSVKELVPAIKQFWPEAKGSVHVDAWRKVTAVNGYRVQVLPRAAGEEAAEKERLFFVNLGGYKAGEFDEFHYKILLVARSKAEAMQQARQTAFYKHTGFKGAPAHVDDKFGVDVDELYQVKDLLPEPVKQLYRLQLSASTALAPDELHLGYFKLNKL
ncbi:DUF1543 domain-containing protein [Pontibacter qinzhouensis]|uniref:DUF1543 domain-containing protein n=1 Tax=Pontibacter qinzhouensis TaxID=2603253 RepID=A0A5C8KBK6_9BACT|nr:DUF1543 domain-containing protein [Pontibacter qinzhouensis]TXK52650.1 DUF1543 domain-containing protein [Pontibacter qinzhouensis]